MTPSSATQKQMQPFLPVFEHFSSSSSRQSLVYVTCGYVVCSHAVKMLSTRSLEAALAFCMALVVLLMDLSCDVVGKHCPGIEWNLLWIV